jgi:signal peptidase II
MSRKYIIFIVSTIIFTLIDQLSKLWVTNNIRYRIDEIELIPGFLSLVHAQNRGAAFGIMQGQMIVFAVFTLVALGVLGQMLWQLDRDDRFQSLALGLIASGAIGNGIDRAYKQSVTDFVRVYTDHPGVSAWLRENFGTTEWPSFNIADAAIVVGLLMFLFHFLFLEKDSEELEPDPPAKALE